MTNFTASDLTMTFGKFCAMAPEEMQTLFDMHHGMNKPKVDATLSEKAWAVFVGGIEDPVASDPDIFTYPDESQLMAIGKKYDRPVFAYSANFAIEDL